MKIKKNSFIRISPKNSYRKTVSVKDKEGFIFLTPAQKIRKMYRQKVSVVGKNSFDKESKIYEDPSKTIRELETIFGSENLDIIKELTMLYEAARYKENSCSSSDVKELRKYAGYCDYEERYQTTISFYS